MRGCYLIEIILLGRNNIACGHYNLVVDKSKQKREREAFNAKIRALSPKINFYISHQESHENMALQAVDLFCSIISFNYKNESVKEKITITNIKFNKLISYKDLENIKL